MISAPNEPAGGWTAKDLVVKPIDATAANRCVADHHYSRKWCRNSQLHLGVFLGDRLEGVMQFGPSLDKRKLVTLVAGTGWNEFVELNRLAFSDRLPRNAESRALAIAFRMLRKNAPHLKWVVSFADASQCGDGTIYRASGFVLTGIRKNTSLWRGPAGDTIADVSVKAARPDQRVPPQRPAVISRQTVTGGTYVTKGDGGSSMKAYRDAGYEPIPGFQIRYVYFLDAASRARLTVPEIPFSRIAELGASMYKGVAGRSNAQGE